MFLAASSLASAGQDDAVDSWLAQARSREIALHNSHEIWLFELPMYGTESITALMICAHFLRMERTPYHE